MAKLKKNIKTINSVLGVLPTTFYHGRIGEPMTKEKMMNSIKIYNHSDEIKGKQFWEFKGKTYLDCAFHGFYLTPCEALARKWALTKTPSDSKVYQILVFNIDKKRLSKLNGKTNIVPDSDWANHIYRNRSRKVVENEYDFVYNFIADGSMSDIMPKIEAGIYENNLKQFHIDILKEKYNPFIKDYYDKRRMKVEEIYLKCQLGDYKNYQMCICSNEALQCIELTDIIELPNNTPIPNDMSVDIHFEKYKKTVPVELSVQLLLNKS